MSLDIHGLPEQRETYLVIVEIDFAPMQFGLESNIILFKRKKESSISDTWVGIYRSIFPTG